MGVGSTVEARRASDDSSSAVDFAHHNCCFCDSAACRLSVIGSAATFKSNQTARFGCTCSDNRLDTAMTTAADTAIQKGDHVRYWFAAAGQVELAFQACPHARTGRPGCLSNLPFAS